MKFKVTRFVSGYTKVGDEYKFVQLEEKSHCNTFDDLWNYLMTIIEASDSSAIKFEVEKEENDESDS